MPLHELTETQLRDACRRQIEGLERWLRRLIDERLIAAYGDNYIDAVKDGGDAVIKSEICRRLKGRLSAEPHRFSRIIDAADLEDAVAIVCKPELYKSHFRDAFADAFPDGCVEARTYLSRLLSPRNALSHARPISVHDAYRVLCYSQDVIASLKTYYRINGMQNQYNVPTAIRVTDSLGHEVVLSDSNRHPVGSAMIDFSQEARAHLRCGDTISIEVDVDPSFDPDSYDVRWTIANVGGPTIIGPKFSLVLTEHYVSTRFCVVCNIISKASWHKIGSVDDQIDIAYRVLPPI